MQQVHGTMSFDSVVGQGTTFSVSFPSTTVVAKVAESSVVKNDFSVSPAQVLVLDDDEMLLEILSDVIAMAHKTKPVSSGSEALGLLKSGERFDVIVCDLMMPNMDGIEFYQELKKQWPELCERVIFLTGGSFTERSHNFLAQKEIFHLEKPVDRNVLFGAIADVLKSTSKQPFSSAS